MKKKSVEIAKRCVEMRPLLSCDGLLHDVMVQLQTELQKLQLNFDRPYYFALTLKFSIAASAEASFAPHALHVLHLCLTQVFSFYLAMFL